MLEVILHTLGICADSHAHLDLMEILAMGALSSGAVVLYRVRCYCTAKFKCSACFVRDLF